MLTVNRGKAELIAQGHIRAWREKQFAENDVKIQNAFVDGNPVSLQDAKNRRDWLRNLPQECEGKSVDELKSMLINNEIIKVGDKS